MFVIASTAAKSFARCLFTICSFFFSLVGSVVGSVVKSKASQLGRKPSDGSKKRQRQRRQLEGQQLSRAQRHLLFIVAVAV